MDEAKAIKWWRKAAKLGQPFAEFNLGEAYITGYGGTRFFSSTSCTHWTLQRSISCSRSAARAASASCSASRSRTLSRRLGEVS